MHITVLLQKSVSSAGIAFTLTFLNSCHSNPPDNTIKIFIELSYFKLIIIFLILLIISYYFIYKIKKSKTSKQGDSFSAKESYLLRTLIDNMPDYIYIKDTKSRFVIANKHTADVMKAGTPENLIGKTDLDFYPKKMGRKFLEDERQIIKTKIPLINIEEEVLDQNNNKLIILTTKVPWCDSDGKVLGIIGMGRNIAKLKEIEKQLVMQTQDLKEINILLEERHVQIHQQAVELSVQAKSLKELNQALQKINETKDKFISIIAHDLKNPFNAIINFSELLILKGDPSIKPKQMEMIKIINSSSKMAYSLLENLLYWAQNQNASIQFFPAPLNISNLIQEVVDFHEVSARLKNIVLINESEPDLNVFADHNMVTTIMRNLISNAIKFTPKNGEVKITTSSDLAYVDVKVTDNGIGMSKEQLEKLFISDKEITKGTSGESGTGFGLLLCNEFALQNRGKITVKSDIEKGSSFILSLPLRFES